MAAAAYFAHGEVRGAAPVSFPALLEGRTGMGRINRLLFVARRSGAQRVEALSLAMAEIRAHTTNVDLYDQTARAAEEAAAAAGGGPVDGGEQGGAWRRAANRKHAERDAALHEEMQAALRASVKATTREVLRRTAVHHTERGEWTAAMAKHLEAKEFAESEGDRLDAALAAVRSAVNANAMGHVKGQVQRALQFRRALDARPAARSQLLAAQGLFELSRHNYAAAASTFLSVDPRHIEPGQGFEDVVLPRDVANYLTLCALATMDRAALKTQLLESEVFRRYADDGRGALAEMVLAFYECRFGACFTELKRLRDQMLLDLFCGSFVLRLSQTVRERALIQYFRPFVSVRIPSMAEAFAVDAGELESELIALIGAKKIHARIDAANRVLHSKNSDARDGTYREVVASGEQYVRHARSALLRMSLVEQGVEVPARRNPDATGAGGDDDDDDDDDDMLPLFGDYGGGSSMGMGMGDFGGRRRGPRGGVGGGGGMFDGTGRGEYYA